MVFFIMIKLKEKGGEKMEECMENKNLLEIAQHLKSFHFPTWNELPTFDLYMDQVITLVNTHLAPLLPKNALLTSSMVNNYVKQKLIPPPNKRKYTKEHLAFLIVISLLKQIMSLPDIKEALLYQLTLEDRKKAYMRFCQLQEQALKEVSKQITSHENQVISFEGHDKKNIFIRSLTLALALKIYSEIILKTSSRREQ